MNPMNSPRFRARFFTESKTNRRFVKTRNGGKRCGGWDLNPGMPSNGVLSPAPLTRLGYPRKEKGRVIGRSVADMSDVDSNVVVDQRVIGH